MYQLFCSATGFGQLSALGTGRFFFDFKVGDVFIAHFVLERCLDGAYNQVLPRSEIACEFSLERLPNIAR